MPGPDSQRTASSRRSAWRAAAQRLALVSMLAVLLLGPLEIGLRIAGVGAADPSAFTRPDPYLLYRIVPHSTSRPWYAIDGHGWRTAPFDEARSEGRIRIVVAGDSVTFGLNVLEDECWSTTLRRALAGLCAGAAKIELINTGVVGYSSLQTRRQIERDVLPLRPDLLVWHVTGLSDATLVDGPDDAERAAAAASLAARLARLRILGWLVPPAGEFVVPGDPVVSHSASARPRVPAEQVEAHVRAVAEMLPGRLVLGRFPPREPAEWMRGLDEIVARVDAVAAAYDLPCVDVRPAFGELLPYPVYLDRAHPSPTGHALMARAVLAEILPRLELPAARRTWLAAWARAQAGGLPREAAALRADGAPPRFRELLALYDDASLDERIVRADPALPAAVLDHDPVAGARARRRSLARHVLEGAPQATCDELREHVRPADPLIACFGDEARLLAAADSERRLARALLVHAAEIGLPPLRVDRRLGLAAACEDPDQAAALLQSLLDLEPDDAGARFERAVHLRRAGRTDEALAEYATLAAGAGPLAILARDVLMFAERDLPQLEAALGAGAGRGPSLTLARSLRVEAALRGGLVGEPGRRLAAALVLIGFHPDLDALLERIPRAREAR